MLVLKTPRQKLERILFSPNGQGLVTAGKFGVFWWPNPIACPKSDKLEATESIITGFSPGGESLVYECVGSAVRVFNTNDNEKLDWVPLQGFFHAQTGTISPTHSHLVRRSDDNTELYCWDVSRPRSKAVLWKQSIRPAFSWYLFTQDGNELLQMEFFSRPGLRFETRLILRRSDDGCAKSTIPIDDYANCLPRESSDGKMLAYHIGNAIVVRSKHRDYESISRIPNPSLKYFTDVAFHPSGQWLAATCNDETVKFYDTESWQVAKTFAFWIGRMRSIAFSPDGTLAAAGSDTGKVVIWDINE
jgi:WD40 repeat protein